MALAAGVLAGFALGPDLGWVAGVGIVILAGVLQNAGIPGSGMALLLGVDRLLDMARTSVNITDLTASLVLYRWVASVRARPSSELDRQRQPTESRDA